MRSSMILSFLLITFHPLYIPLSRMSRHSVRQKHSELPGSFRHGKNDRLARMKSNPFMAIS